MAGPRFVRPKTVEAEVARLRPDLPTFEAATVQQELDGVDAGMTANSLLLGACGAASLFLAAVGVFGLITLSVNQRTNEIGVRLALGSTKWGVVMGILKQALPHIGIGLAVGVLLSLALVRILGSVLPDTASEPAVYVGVVLLLGSVSVSAVLIPAVRSARVEPMRALRYE